ncbi:hypothetical protein BGLT_01980 [Caballeronia glathei]|jgi:hypothetical protein|nr:hypothetical protein B0G84_4938 [Paraburkholderia sp. BL8N3]CDY79284.1 hypothetical protein BGLT_01980 [Caballeronia glathei]
MGRIACEAYDPDAQSEWAAHRSNGTARIARAVACNFH